MRIRVSAMAREGGRGCRRRPRRSGPAWSREPAPGAHLEALRTGYRHHGVYVGGGMVVHYAGFLHSRRAGVIEETTLAGFAVGRPVRVVEHPERSYSAQEIIDRARSRLGERAYRILDNNCEHFCNWCVSGCSHSVQAQRPVARVIQALANAIDLWTRLSEGVGRLRPDYSTARQSGAEC
jgi:Lecithin retinol acyltransferase